MELKTGLFLAALAIGSVVVALPVQSDDNHVVVENRIVGGNDAADGSHPHLVALTDGLPERFFFCGGSLISSRTVLTAAHCIGGVFNGISLSKNLRGTVGTNRWQTGGQTYSFTRNVTHPHWVSASIKNDIALLITSTTVVLSKLVQPVALSYDFVGANVTVKVAGWGLIKVNGSPPSSLQELTTSTIDAQQCVEDMARPNEEIRPLPPVEPHIELCTYISVGRGACTTDSGSALVRADTRALVGVVSWGVPCALGIPDVFARVSAYKEWIQENTV